MKNKKLMQAFALIMAAGLTAAPAVSAMAAGNQYPINNIATENDLKNADIIDHTQKGSLTIYKYDITAAEAAGAYKEGTYAATGEKDSRVESVLADYGVEGVQFSYLRVGDVETRSLNTGNQTEVELVYEIPAELAKILELSAEDAVNMSSSEVAEPCDHDGVYHFTSQQLADALEELLAKDNLSAKNALESYFYDYGQESSTTDQNTRGGVVNMPKTDQDGYTTVDNLNLGLYMVVETEVPENVTSMVNPWFAQLPFTNSGSESGEQWLYDMTCYPKNQTGNPTLDKSVRNTVPEGAAQDALKDKKDYIFGDTATASEGDVLDYILVSKMPHISSKATYLSEYTFVDKLSAGLEYNQNAMIAFYENSEDAKVNNLEKASYIWNPATGHFNQDYQHNSDGTSQLTISINESGFSIINGSDNGGEGLTGKGDGLSDYYMVVYYNATLHSNESVVLGDEGNPNDVKLIWSRTSDGYYNVLEDRNYVYTYALDLTKEFSDKKGDFSKVQFKLYNSTDECYLIAEKDADGIYYVTATTQDEKEATIFTPESQKGTLNVNGMEADTYQLTEVATDTGYSLLKDQIVIDITATDRDVIASVAGVTGMDRDAVDEIIKNYDGGSYNENGDLVTSATDELNGSTVQGPADESANGRTIGKTDMYVGEIQCASATVDGKKATMNEENSSANASVVMSITNSKGFTLPQTGGNGLYAVTILGVVTVAGGCYLVTRKKKVME